jgi:hypothetical protein
MPTGQAAWSTRIARRQFQEQLSQEVVPDLIIYALQMANLYDLDLDATFTKRLNHVLEKHPDETACGPNKASLLADLSKLLRSIPTS